MAHQSGLIAKDTAGSSSASERKTLLRFLICGGVGHGKSAAVGRLLYDCRTTPADAAYCFFSTDRRSFQVFDVPGQESYTRNLLTAAGTADMAVVLVDACEGLGSEARRDSYLLSALGIRRVVLAVNKMDLIGYRREAFESICVEYQNFANQIGLTHVIAIPLSALRGDNVTSSSSNMLWYDGPTLLESLESMKVTVRLAPERDGELNSGDVQASLHTPSAVGDQLQATVIWLHNEPMLPGRPYVMKIGTSTVGATITSLKHKINVSTLEHLAARKLEIDQIGVCNLGLDRRIAFDAYTENRETGGFVLLDRLTNEILGAGLIDYALRRAENIHWQALDVNKSARSDLKRQKPCILWFTGLSGAGKSTIANLVEKRLLSTGSHTYLLDGDNIRHGLNNDLGFTEADRVENIRRVAQVARLMVDAGLIVLVAFISPFRSERRMARELVAAGEFVEVFVDTPLAEAERRDVKGLYRKARRGEILNFTGIDSPYEVPENPEIRIDTVSTSAEQAAALIVAKLARMGILKEGCDRLTAHAK
ncbi:MAG TPA: adenylyl-sulfate kinase [Bryobacteraceae bacterium]|nr:adenylyl-sulfate kinase [Bryobacteraceae bacterium]